MENITTQHLDTLLVNPAFAREPASAGYKVFRKHNASTLFDAFIKILQSPYKDINGKSQIIYTWTQIESKAAIFDSKEEAQKALHELTFEYSNNYSYTYSIS